MNKMLLIILCIVALAGYAMAQNPTYAPGSTGGIHGVDKLGAHNNGGRGCTGCHAPHSGAAGAGGNVGTGTVVDTTNAGNDALWGQDLGPLYGYQLKMGDNGQFVETLPASSAFAVGSDEIRGIMMCLSCHDGNIARGAMMTNQSWEQKFGLLPTGAGGQPLYGSKPIPTLLGNDGTAAGNYNNDHPVGIQATLGRVGVASRWTIVAGKYTTTDAAYLQFIANYGAPTFFGRTPPVLSPLDTTTPTNAYLVCTTCHTPHTMYTFSASSSNKIAGNSSGVYPTYFFLVAPYNPGSQPTPFQASSATQFCRQCHFSGAGGSNEASGIMNVTTAF
ncbi:MAG TPA: hypothetical protein VES66_05355 [Terriglobales bacterium]|nr:hypothetical protein [Terriglobales bacterium]